MIYFLFTKSYEVSRFFWRKLWSGNSKLLKRLNFGGLVSRGVYPEGNETLGNSYLNLKQDTKKFAAMYVVFDIILATSTVLCQLT